MIKNSGFFVEMLLSTLAVTNTHVFGYIQTHPKSIDADIMQGRPCHWQASMLTTSQRGILIGLVDLAVPYTWGYNTSFPVGQRKLVLEPLVLHCVNVHNNS
jgi:hypothetical protein